MAHKNKDSHFLDVYQRFIAEDGRNDNQLERQSNNRLSKGTLRRWRKRLVAKPRSWEPLVTLAALIHLAEPEANQLLTSAGFLPFTTLYEIAAKGTDQLLLADFEKIKARRGGPIPIDELSPPETDEHFTGRSTLRRLISKALQDELGPQIILLSGMGGIGKTTLAAWMANHHKSNSPYFSNGVCWLPLKGGDIAGALQLLANIFQLDLTPYSSLEHKSAALRGVQAKQRFLLCFDDVDQVEELDYLFPAPGPAKVLITTRRKDLVFKNRALTFEVVPFSSSEDNDESIRFFRKVMGGVLGDIQSIREIADLLGHHPLAMSIAAQKMRAQRDERPSRFLERLITAHNRLSRIENDSLNVRATLMLSLEDIKGEIAEFFGQLSAFSGDPFTLEAAAAVAQIDDYTAEDWLDYLIERSLIQKATNRQVVLHPLLQALATELNPDLEASRHLAFQFYINELMQHPNTFEQHDQNKPHLKRSLDYLKSQENVGPLSEVICAIFPWLQARGDFAWAEEWVNHALATPAKKTAAVFAELYQIKGEIEAHFGRFDDADAAYQAGLSILDQTQKNDWSNKIRGQILRRQGSLAYREGNHAYAQDKLADAKAYLEAVGDTKELLALSISLGVLHWTEGNLTVAHSFFSDSLKLAKKVKQGFELALINQNLGLLLHEQEDYKAAINLFRNGLEWAVTHNHLIMQTRLNGSLGVTYGTLGNFFEGEKYLQDAIKLASDLQNPRELLRQKASFAWLHAEKKEYDVAHHLFEAIWQELKGKPWPFEQCRILNMWGKFLAQSGRDPLTAAKRFEQAEKIAHNHTIPKEEARSLFGQAKLMRRSRLEANAIVLANKALAIYTSLQSKEAELVRSWLAP